MYVTHIGTTLDNLLINGIENYPACFSSKRLSELRYTVQEALQRVCMYMYIYTRAKHAMLTRSVGNEGVFDRSIPPRRRRIDDWDTGINDNKCGRSLSPRLRLLEEPVCTGGLSLFFVLLRLHHVGVEEEVHKCVRSPSWNHVKNVCSERERYTLV